MSHTTAHVHAPPPNSGLLSTLRDSPCILARLGFSLELVTRASDQGLSCSEVLEHVVSGCVLVYACLRSEMSSMISVYYTCSRM